MQGHGAVREAWISLHVVTAKLESDAAQVLGAVGFGPYFTSVVGGDRLFWPTVWAAFRQRRLPQAIAKSVFPKVLTGDNDRTVVMIEDRREPLHDMLAAGVIDFAVLVPPISLAGQPVVRWFDLAFVLALARELVTDGTNPTGVPRCDLSEYRRPNDGSGTIRRQRLLLHAPALSFTDPPFTWTDPGIVGHGPGLAARTTQRGHSGPGRAEGHASGAWPFRATKVTPDGVSALGRNRMTKRPLSVVYDSENRALPPAPGSLDAHLAFREEEGALDMRENDRSTGASLGSPAPDLNRDPVLISFVVPALNEADFIVPLLESIRRHTPQEIRHEVIIVDNGSSDGTPDVAAERGASVLMCPHLSLGAIRNEGARASKGRILVFLDADVRLTQAWRENIPATVGELVADPSVISGSACLPPRDGGWIARAWADYSARRSDRSHLGTGHLIVDRARFLGMGGFDPSLSTGEDFEFCRRVEREGGRLAPDDSLEVEHVRFPGSIVDFVRRERWHGSGDGRGWRALRHSSVVQAALLFAVLHAATVAAVLLLPQGRRVWSVLTGATMILALCAVGALRRGGFGAARLFAQRTWLVYWYLWSRLMAAFGPLPAGKRGPARKGAER